MNFRATDPETFKRWTFGDVRVTRVLELPPTPFDPAMFLQATRREVVDREAWLCPDFATDEGDIEAGGKRIMVDPCIGNDKPRGHPLLSMLDTPFLARLERAGFPRESIDVVLCTHLHVDHCGWNTMLVEGAWVPTFPNARYLFATTELAGLRVDEVGDAPAIYKDSVKPIVDAGLADLVEPGHLIVEGVELRATPGHTPGHCSIMISSRGSEAIITGDVIHHPLQVALPDVSSNFCQDPATAIVTRRLMLADAAARDVTLLVAHFAGSSGVKVKPNGEAWIVEQT